MLIYTGVSRTASDVAAEQIQATNSKRAELSAMRQMVEEAISLLHSKGSLLPFGELLHEGWKLKRSLTQRISNSDIDSLYESARRAGAIGGKLLGAGGGGFLLLFVRPEDQESIRESLNGNLQVPVEFEISGSRIIFYDSDGYLPGSANRRPASIRTADPAKAVEA